MKRHLLHGLVGFGIFLAETGAVIAQLGTELETFALHRLHPAKPKAAVRAFATPAMADRN